MKSLLTCIVMMLSLSWTERVLAVTCEFQSGEKRWSIKTSVPDGSDLSSAQALQLQALIDLGNPDLTSSQRQEIEDARWGQATDVGGISLHEGDIVTVDGFLYRSRCQKDGDYHLEIGTSPVRQDASCLIVEIPDPGQIVDPQLKSLIQQARDTLESKFADSRSSHPKHAPARIRISGQFFLDETHASSSNPGGGRGTLLDSGRHCATNVWEVHPVLHLESAPESSSVQGGSGGASLLRLH